MVKKITGGYLAVNESDKASAFISEQFKGQSFDEPIQYPKGLGAKHPFEFEDVELLMKRDGFINEAISKISNAIVTDFEIRVDDESAQALINDFIHNTNFYTVIETWVREGLSKGNGFMELDLDNTMPNGKLAVENIYFADIRKMKDGVYRFWVNQYANRGSLGFKAEIEFNGELFNYEYNKSVSGIVPVADVILKDGEFSIKHILPESESAVSSKEIYGLDCSRTDRTRVHSFPTKYSER